MSSISTIPPLLCNTPPPMDFGDEDEDGDSVLPNDLSLDDEEIGTYKVLTVSQPQADVASNTNVPPLIESSVHVNSTKLLNTGKSNILNIENEVNVKTPARPIEAFNLAISSAFLGSSSPPPMEFDYATPPTFDQYDDNEDDDEEFTDFYNTPVFDCDENNRKEINNEKVEEEEEIDSQKNEDNISLPSLKFDTLSINSDNLSGCSPTPLSHIDEGNAEVSENKEESQEKSLDGDSCSSPYTLPQLPEDLVKMEDVLDDSSDEETHSPKRKNNIKVDENTVDFFAIHTVDDSSPNLDTLNINTSDCEIKHKTIDNETSKENNNNIVGTSCSIPELDKDILKDDDDFDSFTDFTDFQTPETPVETPSAEVYQVTPQQTECSDFDADFNDFVTSELVTSTTNAEDKETALNLEMPKSNVQSSDGHDDDDFDDFQDFTDASSIQQTDSQKKEETENISQAVDTDDEFGEFTDVSPTEVSVTASKPPAYITISSTVNIQDLNGKLNAILNMMFPSENKNPVEDIANVKLQLSEKADEQYLKLDSIDAAKALDYQWTKSEVRHSLIRSLGIDSRNILFGEKWNSSMPRYATSLKPLEPLKPQQVAQHGSTNNDATHSNSKDRSVKTLKSDVPAVEFDWNSSGLVNPLDGTQEDLHKRETETIHTSQLGSADEPIDQQSSYSTLTANDSFSKLADNVNNNNTTPATSTALNTAATATLSSNVPTDSISHNINDISFITDIGISNPSTSLSSFVAANREAKIEIIQQQLTTTTDLPYNLSSTLRNTKVVPGIIDDEVVATSTFAGPLKETHIYTPSKIDAAVGSKAGLNSTNKSTVPIDFDYEIAAAGIIIDETVVKKEYRDIEYNPGFSLDLTKTQSIDLPTNSDKVTIDDDFFGPLQYEAPTSGTFNNLASKTDSKVTIAADAAAEFDDEFSDFQSVLPPMENTQVQSFNKAPQVAAALVPRTKELASGTDKTSRTSTPTLGGGSEMILSPAILLPQAISIESSKPKIEWGEAVASINPDELARIEELFPQPKSESVNLKKNPTITNGYQNQDTNKSLSISATIAEKEQNVDDDDWSEFVSVPAVPEMYVQHKLPLQTQSQNNASNNNNNQFSTNTKRQQQQRQQTNHNVVQVAKPINTSVSSAEEEWSDFVSSAPPPHTAIPYRAMPQFNSAAWKNANFYNNPLSFYQSQTQMQSQTQTHSNLVPKFNHQNNNSNANFSYNNNNSKYNQQQQLQQQQQQHQQHAQQQLQLQQQIHVMQDFSTAPPSLHRLTNAAPVPNHHSSNTQFQVGSAKVAPSISLIPDLGFIAPAATTHTAFINTLPKPTLITKK